MAQTWVKVNPTDNAWSRVQLRFQAHIRDMACSTARVRVRKGITGLEFCLCASLSLSLSLSLLSLSLSLHLYLPLFLPLSVSLYLSLCLSFSLSLRSFIDLYF